MHDVNAMFRADPSGPADELSLASTPSSAPILAALRRDLQRALADVDPNEPRAVVMRNVLQGRESLASLLREPSFARPPAEAPSELIESVTAVIEGEVRAHHAP
ncbi:hypothetical protein OVA26_01110 [Microbacterium sp. SL62]|uniref:hypothetical protein n=1 Tax=Microbacterium sp. SL62 TaxID=2995139 RepID=UPI0022724F73|nr:hypothetical protein [Microbacterium sp. SL62]MCY1715540.1 hypothetical protein [Microbacterium sp. SL62]